MSGLQSSIGKIPENCDFFGQKCVFFLPNIRIFLGSNCFSFILQLNAENRIISELSVMRYMFANFFCMGFIW